ncbi:unnamed protein product [Adineta steineri]|uniref:RING-type domain-containing protein n=1 Tax=Adineta steineri TaxID=433720 RepID=A0A818UTR2_9BILA|nr:unnamed protein product [Adineta steineri]CAF3701604.1 unnamed protein product [Adineta steineri]
MSQKLEKQNVHSYDVMDAAGWTYIKSINTAYCKTCGLKVSEWTKEMDPFAIHAKQSPNCLFVQFKNTNELPFSHISTTDNQEKPVQHRKIDSDKENVLIELKSLKNIRRRTFSHWHHERGITAAQMISAGFFNCNVGDRVICLYCNLICQQWISDSDDPEEVHCTLAPQCPYVRSMLKLRQTNAISIVNENSNDQLQTTNNSRLNEIVLTSAYHQNYIEIPKRLASFTSWPEESLPLVDDFVRAGFFYTGTKTIVTCFYCNGSLQNWDSKDNPMVEHCRWFPMCAYAKQLCGDELYERIQESKRRLQKRNEKNQSKRKHSDSSTNSSQLLVSDEKTLAQMVAARLDLPISQQLLSQNFRLSVIKRCWEEQLRLKQDDFTSDTDLLIACIVLQKQIIHIDGNKENIIIPSMKMKSVREKEQTQTPTSEQSNLSSSTISTEDLSTESQINTKDITTSTTSTNEIKKMNSEDSSSSSSNLCVLCLTEEKQIACIPCGHLATCVPCGHSLRTCPICRKEIKAFIRIYI